ncbi:ATP-binding protein [Reichenbachiella sp. MALMAid0571]|uniref:sensor histidine kinase n=1 Tax=Reichenbachiella sp. MALMAid0571 TaxID=3143939 RepID=UPI0032DFE702
MEFNNFKVNLVVRITLLIFTIVLLVNTFYTNSYTLTQILLFVALGFEVQLLIKFLDKTNQELSGFLNSIKYDDFSHTYTTKKTGTSQDQLYEEFNNVIKKFRQIRAEKEAQHQYLRTIVHHVAIGIITFDKTGEVQIINAAAKNLLNVDILKNINQLRELNENLVASLFDLQTGGRDLIKIEKDGEEVQLSIYAIQLVQMNKEFKLISIQNIKSELDEKEMDAWQNLIRVLTHEIMNSVTPISSLAATVETELETQLKGGLEISNISSDDVQDFYMAVKTIHNRSEGLIKFVSDFRNLTRIPIPNLEKVGVRTLIDHIINLMKYEIEKEHICLETKILPEDLAICADKEQIEQVLINLVKNAIHALGTEDEKKEGKILSINAFVNEDGKTHISIRDNGSGIEEEALHKIFIPFFTTKKSGSGIGLSLSKQIMRKHNGVISVHSEINKGTEFVLKFKKQT